MASRLFQWIETTAFQPRNAIETTVDEVLMFAFAHSNHLLCDVPLPPLNSTLQAAAVLARKHGIVVLAGRAPVVT